MFDLNHKESKRIITYFERVLKRNSSNSYFRKIINEIYFSLEGEIFLLPANIPHSPQRFKNTVGLVVEKTRKSNELDGFQWYCDNCFSLLHEKYIQVSNIVTQLPVIFDEFWSNDNYRRCKKCDHSLEK